MDNVQKHNICTNEIMSYAEYMADIELEQFSQTLLIVQKLVYDINCNLLPIQNFIWNFSISEYFPKYNAQYPNQYNVTGLFVA
jgi:hypothetical protein